MADTSRAASSWLTGKGVDWHSCGVQGDNPVGCHCAAGCRDSLCLHRAHDTALTLYEFTVASSGFATHCTHLGELLMFYHRRFIHQALHTPPSRPSKHSFCIGSPSQSATTDHWGPYGLVASGSVKVLQIMGSNPTQPHMGAGCGEGD